MRRFRNPHCFVSPAAHPSGCGHLAPLPGRLDSEIRNSANLRVAESALRFVDLDAAQINAALDALERSTDHVRSIIVPHG